MAAHSDKLSLAMTALETLNAPSMDYVVDLLIGVAVDFGRLECVGHEGLHFILGKNERNTFDFKDAVGRFRSVLPRLFRRCEIAHPYHITGGVYGFEADVMLSYDGDHYVRMNIRVNNQQAFPELIIETVQGGEACS